MIDQCRTLDLPYTETTLWRWYAIVIDWAITVVDAPAARSGSGQVAEERARLVHGAADGES